MKRRKFEWRRVLSVVLAVSMLAQNCVVTSAGELETQPVQTEAQAETQAPEVKTPETQAQTSAPETKAPETQAQTSAPEAKTPETQAETKAPETQAAASETKETAAAQAETKAPEKAKDKKEEKKEEKKDEKKETLYQVSFEAHSADHGTIRVEGTDITAAAVSSYKKEVKANSKFTFQVIPAEGYDVDHVKVDNVEMPKVAGKTNEYELSSVAKNTVIAVTYKELPKETAAESDAAQTDAPEEAKTEEKTDNAAEADPKADSTEANQSADDATEAEKADDVTGFQKVSMTVGQQSYIWGQDGTDHVWTILNEEVVSIVSKDGAMAELKANAEGTVYIAHDCVVDGENRMETFEITVTSAEAAAGDVEDAQTADGSGTDTEEDGAKTEAMTETTTESETEAADGHIVTFEVAEGAAVTVDGVDVTNTTAMAIDGTIVFTVAPEEGYEIAGVLVDGEKEARTNDATEEADDHIIEGIRTDETIVSVSVRAVETEVETEAAYDITETREVNGTIVTVVYSSAAFDEEVELKVTELSRTEEIIPAAESVTGEDEIVYHLSHDVSFLNKEGQEVEPKEGHPVNVSMNYAFAEQEEVTQLEVVHVPDNGSEEVVADEPQGSSAEVNFTLDSFSVINSDVTVKLSDSGISALAEEQTRYSISINPIPYVQTGKTATMHATVTPQNNNGTVLWAITEGTDLAEIDPSTGEITAKDKTGTIVVQAQLYIAGVPVAVDTESVSIVENTDRKQLQMYFYVANNEQNRVTKYFLQGIDISTAAIAAENKPGNLEYLYAKVGTKADADEPSTIEQGNSLWNNKAPKVTSVKYKGGAWYYMTEAGEETKIERNQYLFLFCASNYTSSGSEWAGVADIDIHVSDVGASGNAHRLTITVIHTGKDGEVLNEAVSGLESVLQYDKGHKVIPSFIEFVAQRDSQEVYKVEATYTGSRNVTTRKMTWDLDKGEDPTRISGFVFDPNNNDSWGNTTDETWAIKVYVRDRSLKVTYDAGAADVTGKVPVDENEYIEGATVTVLPASNLSREGYVFSGWSYGGNVYKPGDTFNMPFNNVTLSALWTPADYAVKYQVQEGQESWGTVSQASEIFTVETINDLQGSTAMANTGYKFVKWIYGEGENKGEEVSKSAEFVPPQNQLKECKTYIAVFERNSYTVEHYLQQLDDAESKVVYKKLDSATDTDKTDYIGETLTDYIDQLKKADLTMSDKGIINSQNQEYAYAYSEAETSARGKNPLTIEAGCTIKIYYNRIVERTTFNDGIAIKAGDSTEDKDAEIRQGQITVTTHYIGGSQNGNGKTGTVKFKWQQYNLIDLKVEQYAHTNEYIIYAVAAQQGKGTGNANDIEVTDHGEFVVDNVVGNTTVDIYLIPQYKVEYYADGEKLTTDPYNDTNVYVATPSTLDATNRVVTNPLTGKLTSVAVQALPTATGYTYTGWTAGTGENMTTVAPDSSKNVSDLVRYADDNRVIKLYCTKTRDTGELKLTKILKDSTQTGETAITLVVTPAAGNTTELNASDITLSGGNASTTVVNNALEVSFTLQSTEKLKEVTLSGLPTGAYTVTEKDANNGALQTGDGRKYKVEINNSSVKVQKTVAGVTPAEATVTNTRQETATVTISKKWLDDTAPTTINVPDTLSVQLKRGDGTVIKVNVDGAVADNGSETITLTKDGGWSKAVTGLPMYDANGEKYSYTVEETVPAGFTPANTAVNVEAIEGSAGQYKAELTNALKRTGSVTVTKMWQQPATGEYGITGYSDTNGNAAATFSLFTDEDCNTPYEIGGTAVTQTTDSNGTATFTGLPYGVYYLKETGITGTNAYTQSTKIVRVTVGDTVTCETVDTTTADDIPMTFKNDLKTAKLTVNKVIEWNGTTKEDTSFTIGVSYTAENTSVDGTLTASYKKADGAEEESLTYAPNGFPNGKAANNEITVPYGTTVELSETAPGWTPGWSENVKDGSVTVNGNTTVTLTNTRNLYNGNGKLTVTKTFAGVTGSTEVKPDGLQNDIILTLYSKTENGTSTEVTSESIAKGNIPAVVDGSCTAGTVTFENLPANDLAGNPLTYTVKENGENNNTITLEGSNGKRSDYTVAYGTETANDKTELTVTNTYNAPGQAQVTITAGKELTGGLVLGNDYSFTLAQADDDSILLGMNDSGVKVPYTDTAQNNGSTISFATITIAEPGTYRFTVTENAGGKVNVTNDENAKSITLYATRSAGSNTLEIRTEGNGIAVTTVNAGTFTNTAKTGTLTLTKILKDSEYNAGNNDSYTLVVTAETAADGAAAIDLSKAELENGTEEINVAENESSFEVTLTPEEADGTISASATITGLPEGNYKVEEKGAAASDTKRIITVGNKKYTVTGETGEDTVAVSGATPKTVTITNTRFNDSATLTFTKIWQDGANNSAAGHPDVTIQVKQNGADYGNPVTLTSTDAKPDGSWQKEITVPMFSPEGALYTYTVEETAIDGFTASPVTPVTATADTASGTYTASITNAREYGPEGGSLSITKQIKTVGNVSYAGMENDTFSFKVTGPSDLTGRIDYTIDDVPGNTTVDETDHSFTVDGVKNGQTVTVTNALPTGTYTVSETAADGNTYKYTATYKVNSQEGSSASVTKEAGAAFTVENIMKQMPDDQKVSITKTWEQPNGAADIEKAYGFGDGKKATAVFGLFTDSQATQPYRRGGVQVTAEAVDGAAAEFTNLPAGMTYYVKEIRLEDDDDSADINAAYTVSNKILTLKVTENGTYTLTDASGKTDRNIRNELKKDTKLTIKKVIDWAGTAEGDISFAIGVDYTTADNTVKGTLTASFAKAEGADEGTITYTSTGFPKDVVNGNVITLPYGTTVTVSENALGWTPEWSENVTANGSVTVNGNAEVTVTNTRELYNGDGTLTVDKVFAGVTGSTEVKPNGLANDIVLELIPANDTPKTIKARDITITDNGTAGTVTFEHLPKYGLTGSEQEIQYSVKEQGEADGSIVLAGENGKKSNYGVSYTSSTDETTGETVMTVTNTYTAPEAATVAITASKELTGGLVLDNSYKFTLTQSSDDKVKLGANGAQHTETVSNTAGTVTFTSIPVTEPGTYHFTVTESTADGKGNVTNSSDVKDVSLYATRSANSNTLEIRTEENGTAVTTVNAGTFTNTAKTGTLTLTKVLKDSDYNTENKDIYTLVVTAQDPADGDAAVDLSKAELKNGAEIINVAANGNSFEVALTPVENNGTISASARITGLPEGNYKVEEQNATGNSDARTVTVGSKTYKVTGESTVAVSADAAQTVTVTNTRADAPTTLTFTKTWANVDNAILPDDLAVTVWQKAADTAQAAEFATLTIMPDSNGVWTATVNYVPVYDANGQRYSYTVSETVPVNYNADGAATTTVTNDTVEAAFENGAYTATISNSRKTGGSDDGSGSLTITKTVTKTTGADITRGANDSFSFTVIGPDDLKGTVSYTITKGTERREDTATVTQDHKFTISGVKDGETVTVTTKLPTGAYSVTEAASSTNKYEYTPTIVNDSDRKLAENGTINFTATNALKEKASVEVKKLWQQPDGTYSEQPEAAGGTSTADSVATYTLYTDEALSDEYATATTEEHSDKAVFTNIPYGTYYVKETYVTGTAYEVSDTVLKVTVGDSVTYEVETSENAQQGDMDVIRNDLKTVTLTVVKAVNAAGTKDITADVVFNITATSTDNTDVGRTIVATYNGTETTQGANNTIEVLAGTSVTLNEEKTGWSSSWKKGSDALTKDANGNVTVTVDADTTVTVTNTRTLFDPDPDKPEDDGTLTATKAWAGMADADVKDRAVTLHLYRKNGDAYMFVESVETARQSKDESEGTAVYTAVFGNGTAGKLPKYDADGNEITYAVREKDEDVILETGGSIVFAEGALSSKYNVENNDSTYTVTNSYAAPNSTSLTLTAEKELTGRKLTAGMFEFEVVQDTKNPQTFENLGGSNVAEDPVTGIGSIALGTLASITKTGDYKLTVSEKAGTDSKADYSDSVDYSAESYEVTFKVARSNDNQLEIQELKVNGQEAAAVSGVLNVGSFRNESRLGSLTLKKELKDSTSGGTFTLVVTAPEDVKLGSTVTVGDTTAAVTTDDAGRQIFEVELTTNANETASSTVSGLPVGDYTVMEKDAAGDVASRTLTVTSDGKTYSYKVTGEGTVSVTVGGAEKTVTNTRTNDSAVLTVVKEWNSVENAELPESLMISVYQDNETVPAYTFDMATSAGTVKNGNTWTYTIEDVPMFSDEGVLHIYRVEEATLTGYTAAGSGENAEAVPSDGTYRAELSNTRKLGNGEEASLTLTKTITADGIKTLPDEMILDDTFSFTVEGPVDLKGTIRYEVKAADGAVTVLYAKADGGEFTIPGVKHGDTVSVLTALPTGTYRVTETPASGNRYQYTPDITGGADGLELEENGTVAFEAKNALKQSSFTVSKTWQGLDGSYSETAYGAKDGKATAQFGLYTDKDATKPYKLDGAQITAETKDGKAGFENVPYGTYYVKETDITGTDAYDVSNTITKVTVGDTVTFGESDTALTIRNDLKSVTLTLEKVADWKGTTAENVDFEIAFNYEVPEKSVNGTVTAAVTPSGVSYTTVKDGVTTTGNMISVPYGTVVYVSESKTGWKTVWSGKNVKAGEDATTAIVTVDGDTTATVTNTRELLNEEDDDPKNDGKLTATKIWNFNGAEVQPKEITLNLYAVTGQTGGTTASAIQKASLTADRGDGATAEVTFENLPKYSIDGEPLSYIVRETDAVGRVVGSVTGSVTGGSVVFTEDGKSSRYVVVYDDVNHTVTNSYNTFQMTFKAAKDLVGRTLGADYSFNVTEDDANPQKFGLAEAKNAANGSITFGIMVFNLPGHYKFTVAEKAGGNDDVENSKEVYTVEFDVEDGASDTLQVNEDSLVVTRKTGASASTLVDAKLPENELFIGTFTNTTKTGTLKLTKVLKDSTADGTDSFTFTVTAPDGVVLNDEGVELKNVTADQAISAGAADFTVTLTPQKQTDGTYKAEAEIGGLPVGTYTVAEENAAANAASVTVDGKTYAVEANGSSTVEAGETAEYTVTNTRKETAKLTFTKQWQDEEGNDLTNAHDKLVPTELTAELKQNGTLNQEITLTKPAWTSEEINVPMFDENGQAYEYTIVENEPDGYTAATIEAQKQDGATVTATADYVNNTYTATMTNIKDSLDPEEEENKPTKEAGTPTVTHIEAGETQVQVGGEITYTISWKNHLNTNAIISIRDAVPEGTELVSASAPYSVDTGSNEVSWTIQAEPFESGTVTITVKVTEDALKDVVADPQVKNTAYVTIKNSSDVGVEDVPAEADPIPVYNPDWTVEKALDTTNVKPEGNADETTGEKGFALGQKPEFKITVTNTGNAALHNIVLTETSELPGDAKFVADGDKYAVSADGKTATITTLAVGAEIELKAEYTVTEEDLGKTIKNVVTSKADEEPDTPPDDGEEEIPTDTRQPALTVEKKVSETPAATGADGKFALGDTVKYEVEITNSGNLTLKDVTLEDVMTGSDGTTEFVPSGFAEAVAKEGELTVTDGKAVLAGELAVGEAKVITYTHVVTEKDLDDVLTNVATASGTPMTPDPSDPDKEPEPVSASDDAEAATTGRQPILTVTKTVTSTPAAANGKYTVGETITYRVRVENTGNLTIQLDDAASIQDVLTRPDNHGAIEPSGIETLKNALAGAILCPKGQETETLQSYVEAEYTHVVTDQDLGGELKNVVIVSGKSTVPDPTPDPENPEQPPKDEDDETVITDDPFNSSIVVTKQLTDIFDNLISLNEATFYVSLFEDEAMTKRVGDVQPVSFGTAQATSSVTFDKLQRGTYYVAETDASGNVLGTNVAYDGGVYSPVYANGQRVEITENAGTAQLSFSNQFLVLPNGYYAQVTSVDVTKKVLNNHGKAKKSTATFYAGVFTDAAYTKLATADDGVSQSIIPIKMSGNSSASASIEIANPDEGTKTFYITEVSSNGTPVEKIANFAYDWEVENGVLTLDRESTDASVVITNTSNADEEITVEENENQNQNESNEESEKTGVKTRSVKTGDETPIIPFAMMLAISAIMLVILGEKRRRRGEN